MYTLAVSYTKEQLGRAEGQALKCNFLAVIKGRLVQVYFYTDEGPVLSQVRVGSLF